MLAHLSIRDIVLIDRLDLAFAPGLTVLTGETGAGKSILLDAFSLALGGRGDGALVRHGQAQGQVTAVFDIAPDHPARALAAGQGLDAEGDLILRRVQLADGRSRAFVNDQPTSVQTLRAIGAALVEIHGQHDDRALTDPATHRVILDAYGGHGALCEAVRMAARALAEAKAALAERTAQVEAARKEADFLRHAADELGKLGVEPGEEEALATRRQGMMQAEKVAQELSDAVEALQGPAAPLATLSGLLRRLERRKAQAPHLIEPCLAALDAALTTLDEAGQTVERALAAAQFDPRALERTEERLFALRAAARKYDCQVEALPALAARYAADLAALDAGEGQLKALAEEVAAAEAAYVAAAEALSQARAAAAERLDAAVNAELGPLKLERALFITQLQRDETARGPEGCERAEFWVRTNPGTRPGPMVKVASGGELSRFMLALKVALADTGSAPTLVFDEIDTGVGGAVADAIGERLARLARRVQVVAVTHAPQVAAKAAHHLLIAKAGVAGAERVATQVEELIPAARREEIARMLAGATITDEARAAAQRLLDAAMREASPQP
jgi:DNA repair protein RecN (Recombination protein N)